MNKLIKLWKSKTPAISRFLQSLSVALAALPLYFNGLPEEIKATIPPNVLYVIAVLGGIVTLLLQLTTKKQSK